MTRSKAAIPADIATLARWLAESPKAAIKALEAHVEASSQEEHAREREALRVALKQAWDEQPDVFFGLLQGWLKADAPRLRWLATGALPVSSDAQRERCGKALKKLILDPDPEVRLMALDLSAEDPEQTLELCKRCARDDDPAVRALVARHLRSLELADLPKGLALLERLALDREPDVHWAAAGSLLELYDRDPRPVLEVARLMASAPDEPVRAAAAAGVFEHLLADHFDPLLPTLRAWLRSGTVELRWTLVRSLRFVRVNGRSVQLLRVLYEDQDPEIRRRLVQALLDLFDPKAEHRRALAELIQRARQDPAKRVRDVVEEGEARFGAGFDTAAAASGYALDDDFEEGEGEEEEEEDDD